MITVDRIVVVEGKYDRIKLAGILDATVICTDGFGIFKNEELKKTLRTLAEKRGLLILTDSDGAGFAIRNYIVNLVGAQNVVNAYIPDIRGKEKRKAHASAEGTLGVEGVDETVILSALEKAGVTASKARRKKYLTKTDFYLLGLSGGENSSARRDLIKKELGLPKKLSANALVEMLNIMLDEEAFRALLKKIGED